MKLLKLYDGRFTKLDDEDYEKLSGKKWGINGHGYVSSHVSNSKTVYLHHLILGHPSIGFVVHHKDGDRLNNQKSNLEFKSHSLHKYCHPSMKSSTGFRGVTRAGKYFQARIGKNGFVHFIGSFKSAEDAAKAYDKEAIKMYGASATLNFCAAPEASTTESTNSL